MVVRRREGEVREGKGNWEVLQEPQLLVLTTGL